MTTLMHQPTAATLTYSHHNETKRKCQREDIAVEDEIPADNVQEKNLSAAIDDMWNAGFEETFSFELTMQLIEIS